jgi:hypothetical protein
MCCLVSYYAVELSAQVNPRQQLKDSIHVWDSIGHTQKPEEVDVSGEKKKTPVFKSIPYPSVSESDVGLLQVVGSQIDLQDPANQHLISPSEQSAIAIILDAMRKLELPVYADADCKKPLTVGQVNNLLQHGDTILQGSGIGTPLAIQSISALQMIEIYFLNKRLGKLERRVFSICLMREQKDSLGESLGLKPICGIYFPDARYFLRNKTVYNFAKQGTKDTLTYEHIFLEHKYNSLLTKANHISGRSIRDYQTGPGARREAELTKDKWFERSQGLGED